MKYYLVTGRMIGDDEDTTLTYDANSRDAAVAAYIEELWEKEKVLGYSDPGEPDAEWRARLEANGEGVVINGVFVSYAPIMEAT